MRQDDIIARLAAGEPFDGHIPERIDTHISILFLTGQRAYKLKRCLKTAYLDYRTLESRKRGCLSEIEINRRTAPEIYRSAVPVSENADGCLVIGGTGNPIEWLVEMNQFDPNQTFDNLAAAGRLDQDNIMSLADQVAQFHQTALVVRETDFQSALNAVITSNQNELLEASPTIFDAGHVVRLTRQHEEMSNTHADTLTRRAANRFVRECHGDLHLGNICLLDGEARIFDAIEFSPDYSNIDILYDLSFLLMDFAQRGSRANANLVFNRYLYRMADYTGLELLPMFQSIRAVIRAHVCARRAMKDDRAGTQSQAALKARSYLDLAGLFLERTAPQLIAIGGYSGTGKTTVATRIAPLHGARPGAVVLSSDPIRKRTFGVKLESRLAEKFYGPQETQKVYDRMFADAAKVLAAGRSVILDATFMTPEHRAAAEAVARAQRVPFSGYWLTGCVSSLAQRIVQRTKGASDATPDILQRQLDSGPGDLDWRKLDATADNDEVFQTITNAIR